MIGFFDSSALVKLVVLETHSKETADWARGCERAAAADISLVEVAAALAQAARLGRLQANEARSAYRRFLRYWPDFVRVGVRRELLDSGAQLAWRYELRGYDAVQLAAALETRALADGPMTLACFDRRLRAAGLACGLNVWPDPWPSQSFS